MIEERAFKRRAAGIACVSLLAIAIISACLAFFPHEKLVLFSIYHEIALLILGIVATVLVLEEKHRRNKIIFGLFVILGFQQILNIIYSFVPAAFPDNRFAGHQYFQIVNGGVGLLVRSACLAGAAILMNTRIKTWLAMTMVVATAIIILASQLNPIFLNSKHLYTTPDITDFRIIDRAWMAYYQERGIQPDAEEVAERIKLSKWEGRRRVGELSYGEAVERVKEIEPYLFGSNYNMLIYKPMNNLSWQMNLIVGIGVLMTILYWFFGGAPMGVYFERISVVVLSFNVFEVFHYHTYANLTSYSDYLNYFNIGALLSLLAVVILVFLFLLRLRFLLSHEGQYYESRLAHGGVLVAQWRDGFDDYLLRKFFGGNPFKSRFLTRILEKQRTDDVRKKTELFRKNT